VWFKKKTPSQQMEFSQWLSDYASVTNTVTLKYYAVLAD